MYRAVFGGNLGAMGYAIARRENYYRSSSQQELSTTLSVVIAALHARGTTTAQMLYR